MTNMIMLMIINLIMIHKMLIRLMMLMMMTKTHSNMTAMIDNADSHHNDDEAHGVKSRWALQQDRLYFNNKIFVFNATTQQVIEIKYFKMQPYNH